LANKLKGLGYNEREFDSDPDFFCNTTSVFTISKYSHRFEIDKTGRPVEVKKYSQTPTPTIPIFSTITNLCSSLRAG